MPLKNAGFSDEDYWKALVLYGLNQATYKIALGKTLLDLGKQGITRVSWDQLSAAFLTHYSQRLSGANPMPQQATPHRRTRMEQIVASMQFGMSYEAAVTEVGQTAFGDVIPRFHNLGKFDDLQGQFYRVEFGKHLDLTDGLLRLAESDRGDLMAELDARWSLLEGAFAIGAENFELANEVRTIYLQGATSRTDLTDTVPFLQGYQGNRCFYCCEPIHPNNIHVDHALPRQVVLHDEIWNLVLAHDSCNLSKSDYLLGEHFLLKLIVRNENIMGSNHPWKKKISQALGDTRAKRASALRTHYNNVQTVLGPRYWGGTNGYNPATDPFYRRLVTVLNNSN
jgi:hypothetical protein